MERISLRRRRADSIADGAKGKDGSPYTGDNNESSVHASLPAEWIRPKKIHQDTRVTNLSITSNENAKDNAEKLSPTAKRFNPYEFSVSRYLYLEVFGGYCGVETSTKEHKAVKNINNFIEVPIGLEKLVMFGFLACLDTFLYTFTTLPMRVIIASSLLFLEVLSVLFKDTLKLPSLLTMNRIHLCDLMRGLLLLIGCGALQLLNMSRVYHYIRGQTTVKLYVLTGMLEVFDRLLNSFGLDAFDSLYYQTRQKTSMSTMLASFSIVAVYVVFHSFLYFTQIATLTVATNSTDQAMITVMIINNFTEIKGSVFKKFDKHNLFQLACSDVTERFQLCLYMIIIFLVGIAQAGSIMMESVQSFLKIVLTMLICEACADWIKHAFIIKLNQLEPSLYGDFARVLRTDVLKSQKDKIVMERTYGIARRLGFPQIPLACVCVRYMNLMLSTPFCSSYLQSWSTSQTVFLAVAVFVSLCVTKVNIGVSLIFYAGYITNEEMKEEKMEENNKSAQVEDNLGNRVPTEQELGKHRDSVHKLSDIERYSTRKGKLT